MNVAMLCCHVVLPCASRDSGLRRDVAKRIVMAVCTLHGLRFGGKPGHETLCFLGKVAAADDERYLVCAAGVAAVVLMFFCRSGTVASSYFGILWLCLCHARF